MGQQQVQRNKNLLGTLEGQKVSWLKVTEGEGKCGKWRGQIVHSLVRHRRTVDSPVKGMGGRKRF